MSVEFDFVGKAETLASDEEGFRSLSISKTLDNVIGVVPSHIRGVVVQSMLVEGLHVVGLDYLSCSGIYFHDDSLRENVGINVISN